MSETDLRVIKSQRAIVAAFNTLVQRNGFEQLTVKQLCAEALMGRSTFYRYYQDKYDLLNKLVLTYCQQFERLLDQRLNQAELDQVLTNLYRELVTDRETLTTLFSIHEPEGDLQARFTEILEKRLMVYLEPLTLPVPRDFLGTLYATNVLTVLMWSLKNGVDGNVTQLMNHLFHTVQRAYSPE